MTSALQSGHPEQQLSPIKMRWWRLTYADVRSLRDEATDPVIKGKLTNVLAGLILIKDEP